MPVVCMLNQKGGVGKTSTCFHLSGTLAQLGRRVLLVDNDPQASLTQGFLGPDVMRALAPGETIASLYAGEDPLPGQVIRDRHAGDRPPRRLAACAEYNAARAPGGRAPRSRAACGSSWARSRADYDTS